MRPRTAILILLTLEILLSAWSVFARTTLGLDYTTSVLLHHYACRWPMICGAWCMMVLPLAWWASQADDGTTKVIGFVVVAYAWVGVGHIFWAIS